MCLLYSIRECEEIVKDAVLQHAPVGDAGVHLNDEPQEDFVLSLALLFIKMASIFLHAVVSGKFNNYIPVTVVVKSLGECCFLRLNR